ncbi:spore germination protein [Cohnella thailandensis]|uniref:Spore germination protein n=1 Tax=Cohnella thailandensis TaxID=557557 RepID=A0A841SKY0_9BACL|nr:spore germination protein [Cohnella thailandensis]MBB6633163.1 spore germination protein [Cohnella thailandensis]MBP1975141.1 spore germination protein KA [Cohnella thailandensis]
MRRKTGTSRFADKPFEDLGHIAERNVSDKLEDNERHIRTVFDKCADLVVRRLDLPGSVPCLAVYLNMLIDDTVWEEGVLKPLLNLDAEPQNADRFLEDMVIKLGSSMKPQIADNMPDIVRNIVHGSVALFIEGQKRALRFIANTKLHRQLDEPVTEAIIRGPRIGFIENIDVNMSLLRQYIRSPLLKMERMSAGSVSQTEVTIAYLETYAPQSVIDEIYKRLERLHLESIISSGYVEELISDHPNSPFPTIQATERPDTVAASLIEGKAALLVSGTPMVLVMPITFWFGFQSVEDYFMSFIFATMLRWLRFTFAFMAMALPALFVAITTFHQEMIPTSLALSLAAAREVVPFPAMIETLIMETTFEALREAGVRLPRPVGQTISIVGALVIGQAAVQAGIISAPIIIVVSMTGIASFLLPHYGMSQAISLLRFGMVFLGGMFGLYGVVAGMIALLIHLSNLQSFGVPYLWPIAPFNRLGLMDVFIRVPWQYMKKRKWHKEQQLELDKS